jgi:hypothetical protein
MKAGSCLRVGRLARDLPFHIDHLTSTHSPFGVLLLTITPSQSLYISN